MIRAIILTGLSLTLLSACARAGYGQGGSYYPAYQPRPGQGQYVRPDYLAATPTPMIPAVDACRSQLYAGLVGQHEGAIYISGLPGRKRVLKPAFLEAFGEDPAGGISPEPPLIEVRDYLPQQVLYAPSIRTVTDRIQLGPQQEDRLTIELDVDGYVQELRCG